MSYIFPWTSAVIGPFSEIVIQIPGPIGQARFVGVSWKNKTLRVIYKKWIICKVWRWLKYWQKSVPDSVSLIFNFYFYSPKFSVVKGVYGGLMQSIVRILIKLVVGNVKSVSGIYKYYRKGKITFGIKILKLKHFLKITNSV